MAKIIQASFVIAVPDLGKSAAYYQDVLGFTVREIGDPGWRFFEKDSCQIRAGHCPDAIPPGELGDHNYFAYLTVNDIDAYYEFVTGRNAKICSPLGDRPWGMREFAVETVDGHRIMFGQDI